MSDQDKDVAGHQVVTSAMGVASSELSTESDQDVFARITRSPEAELADIKKRLSALESLIHEAGLGAG